ncbi:NADPH-dependent FMN reductase [Dongia deserti]|uniref:NADPH-dependent FMN reductase n=1 Tax=Dongia deserti TaxID=2268030 RepID=UPI000E65B3CC|nr:NAD(P)H-dependent oxidoreductase [Dongia deserti]
MALPKVAVINGSLRKESINKKLALAIAKLAAGRLDLQLLDIADLPLYNQDLEANFPAAATRVKNEIAAADAVLFVTPEHSRSIPAALKNVIDWVARPYGKSNWLGKPGAIVGTSGGQIGTALAQDHLRSVALTQGIAVLGRPEIYFTYKDGVFDAEHNVTDPQAKQILQGFVDTFVPWVAQLAPAGKEKAA